jgi:NADP-dependent 3-hydroxy acid dehydrogenase YdfG
VQIRGKAVEGISKSPKSTQVPPGTHFTRLDCTDTEEVPRFWQRVHSQYCGDTRVILINNAGTYHKESFESLEVQNIVDLLNDNFLSSVNMSKGLLEYFQSGTIVNINSIDALIPRAGRSAYGAAKAAQANFYSAARSELPAGQLRIMNIYPHTINTWSDEPVLGTIDRKDLARWIIDMALLDGSFEIADCKVLPFGSE